MARPKQSNDRANRAKTPSSWPRRILRFALRGFAALTLLLVALGAVCCTMLDFESDFDGDETVARRTIPTTIGGESYEVSVLVAGNPRGRQVVFVHGTPGDATNFLDLLHACPNDLQYVALDRPGFGRTRPDHAVPSLDAQADAVIALLETRDGKAPILVGHSLGGPIVAAVAARRPVHVGGVLEVAGSLDPDLEETLWIQYVGETPPFVWWIPTALRNCNREIFALRAELERLAPRLADISAPVVILHGTDDTLVPYQNVPYMQKHLTSATAVDVVTLEGGDHFLPWNAEDEIQRAIRRLADGTVGMDALPERGAALDATGPAGVSGDRGERPSAGRSGN
jgi:pimeloyl-ACP methyl ester carboxylesterase